MDSKANLLHQVNVLKEENSELAKELSKITNMLQIQKDIDKESKIFFEQRTKQHELLEMAARAKMEELCRQADLIAMERINAQKEYARFRDPDYHDKDIDEDRFSVNSKESNIADTENMLDFKIK